MSRSEGSAAPVDVLAFIVGDPSTWPRIATQFQPQLVDIDARSVRWVKYGNPDMFDCWRWDDEWIYLSIDHAVDGNTGGSYTFSFLTADGCRAACPPGRR